MQNGRRIDAILELIANGRTDKEIATLLFVSVPTVRKHLQRFFHTHHLHGRTAAVLYWISAGGSASPAPAVTRTLPPRSGVRHGERLPIDGVLEDRLTQWDDGPAVDDPYPMRLPYLSLEPTAFRNTMGHFPTGVTIMTTVEGSQWHGMTASAFCSVSLNPLLVMVSVAQRSLMHHLVTRSRVFAINILGAEHEALGRFFADTNRCRETQFRGLPIARGITGCPILLEATVYVEATVRAAYDGGDHSLVLGKVAAMGVLTGHRPLVFYRGRYTSQGGLVATPFHSLVRSET